jgi:hypothetical protein
MVTIAAIPPRSSVDLRICICRNSTPPAARPSRSSISEEARIDELSPDRRSGTERDPAAAHVGRTFDRAIQRYLAAAYVKIPINVAVHYYFPSENYEVPAYGRGTRKRLSAPR